MIEAISTSDWHLDGLTKHFKNAIERQLKEIDKIYQYALENGIKHIFIPGDISDKTMMPYETYMALVTFFKKYDGIINSYYLGGNHDRSDVSTTSCDFLKMLCDTGYFKTLKVYLSPERIEVDGVPINMCAWPCEKSLTSKENKNVGAINFAHVATSGAIGDNGRKMKLKKDEFTPHKNDYTVSGHIHQYQHIESKRLVYNGNPFQKNFGESLPKGFIHFKAKLSGKEIQFKHQFVDNHPDFTLENVIIESSKDFEKLSTRDNIRYKLTVSPEVTIPSDLRLNYPNITGGIFAVGSKKQLNSDEPEMVARPSHKLSITSGLKKNLETQGLNKNQLKSAKKLVESAKLELNL